MESETEVYYPPALVPTSEIASFFDLSQRSPPWTKHVTDQRTVREVQKGRTADSPTLSNQPKTILPRPQIETPSIITQYTNSSHLNQPSNATLLTPEQVRKIDQFISSKRTAAKSGFTGIFASLSSTLGTTTAAKDLSRKWLRERNVTLENLIVDIGIPITDLYRAHLTRTVADLVELEFTYELLNKRREYFSADHAVQLFQMRACDSHGELLPINVADLATATPQFEFRDLATLGVTAASLLTSADGTPMGPEAVDLLSVLKPREWYEIGLTKEHLQDWLKLTASVAQKRLRWSSTELKEYWDL